jgi:hypothetical protein
MGVKLSAKLAGIDAKRIIAATLSFIFIPKSSNFNSLRQMDVQVALAGSAATDLCLSL